LPIFTRRQQRKFMTDNYDTTESRRRFLKFVGGGALILPVAGLTACSGGDNAEAPSTAAPAPSQPETAPASEAPPADDAGATGERGGMPRLDENDPQAQALGYVHEAVDADTTKYPQYVAGQMCSICAQYQGGADEEWASCSIFPGRLVKSMGWCSVYVPKAG
jgi:hypothetical protein